MSERDLFANFERMRREMDELFGDVFDAPAVAPARRVLAGGRRRLRPDPPRAIVHRRAGRDRPDGIEIEIEGRKLLVVRQPAGGRVARTDIYQQVEIARGPFRRVIELGADVRGQEAKATYEDGMLRIELPLAHEPGPPARSLSAGWRRERDRDRHR